MAGVCEVCAAEPSKYRCPTCKLMSCSLACTQAHKIYCAPKAEPPKPLDKEPSSETNGHPADVSSRPGSQNDTSPAAVGSCPQVKDLLERYPSLREQLQDIYKATLEEEWVESHIQGGRSRPYGRGRGGHRSRGPWTREKGFNRALGKVRKLRERCDDGLEAGTNAEGFMQFMAAVNAENSAQPSA